MKKIVWLMIIAVAVMLAINYFQNENPVTSYNIYRLKQNIRAIMPALKQITRPLGL